MSGKTCQWRERYGPCWCHSHRPAQPANRSKILFGMEPHPPHHPLRYHVGPPYQLVEVGNSISSGGSGRRLPVPWQPPPIGKTFCDGRTLESCGLFYGVRSLAQWLNRLGSFRDASRQVSSADGDHIVPVSSHWTKSKESTSRRILGKAED